MVLATTISKSSSPTSPYGFFDSEARQQTVKAQLCLDGLEPYVLVSAITSTASFSVLTQGNAFVNGTVMSADGMQINWLKVTSLFTSMSSSVLGLYSLGVFSFCILYSKAAMGRIDELHIYRQFFNATAKYRYRGYISFVLSLILFVINIFLFALMYLPEPAQGYAAACVVIPFAFGVLDWRDIIRTANIIYQPGGEKNKPLEPGASP
eukprot:scaffold24446_cov127-Cylindrotheca_fusiformis.AAC.1